MEKYYCDLYTFVTADVEPTNNRAKVETYKTLKRLKIYEMVSGDLILGDLSKTQKTILPAFQVDSGSS